MEIEAHVATANSGPQCQRFVLHFDSLSLLQDFQEEIEKKSFSSRVVYKKTPKQAPFFQEIVVMPNSFVLTATPIKMGNRPESQAADTAEKVYDVIENIVLRGSHGGKAAPVDFTKIGPKPKPRDDSFYSKETQDRVRAQIRATMAIVHAIDEGPDSGTGDIVVLGSGEKKKRKLSKPKQ